MKRLFRNLRFLGPAIFTAWLCPWCRWLNRRSDETCLLCPAKREAA